MSSKTLDLVTIGFGHAPKAYTDEKGKPGVAPPAVLAQHHFCIEGGRLVHSIDGVQRAVIPPEGMSDYAELWPDCAPLVKAASSGKEPVPIGTEHAPAPARGAAGILSRVRRRVKARKATKK